jgi:triacylglycerol esterase/lipase EstA (alpha/beta hydrolase family)
MRISIFIIINILSFSNLVGQNQYPIVLIHGFMGWGTEEMAGYKYWGGKHDFEEYLESLGYEVYTVSIALSQFDDMGPIETVYTSYPKDSKYSSKSCFPPQYLYPAISSVPQPIKPWINTIGY